QSLHTISLILFIIQFLIINDPASTEIYTLSLHDALPISEYRQRITPGQKEIHQYGMRSDFKGVPQYAERVSEGPGPEEQLFETEECRSGDDRCPERTTCRTCKFNYFKKAAVHTDHGEVCKPDPRGYFQRQ